MDVKFKDFRRRIARIKESITMADLIRHYGGTIYDETRECQTRCILPDHDDRNPSARVFPDSNVLHCFVCGFHGDVLDVTQRMENTDGLGAIRYLEEQFNLEEGELPQIDYAGRNYEATERVCREWLERIIADRLTDIKLGLPKSKLYLYFIWVEFLYERYDNDLDCFGNVVQFYNFARGIIGRYIEPMLGELPEYLIVGGIR